MPREDKCQEAARGIGNLALYEMCAKWPDHSNAQHVADKILVIGRVYSASPSRGLASSDAGGFFECLAAHLVSNGADVDAALGKLRKGSFPDIKAHAVALHEKLDELIVAFTKSWKTGDDKGRNVHSRASFVSKYLHFHAPDAFPILDKYSELGIPAEISGRRKRGMSRYGHFCESFAKLMHLPEYEGKSLRHIDAELVRSGREVEARKLAQRAQRMKGK